MVQHDGVMVLWYDGMVRYDGMVWYGMVWCGMMVSISASHYRLDASEPLVACLVGFQTYGFLTFRFLTF